MNGPIRKVAGLAGVMFLALLINLTFLSVFQERSLNSSQYNRRVLDEQFAQDRGAILVGNTPIAETQPAADQLRFQRVYPQGPMYAPVTGYYSYQYARSGLEAAYNAQLSGADSSLFVGQWLDKITGRTPQGAVVQTTLNAKAQTAAFKGLGRYKGAVVAINFRTGAILALVTTPSYDPNVLASHDIKATETAWNQFNADPNRPMADRAAAEIYPPGSTFKLVTAAAALADGMTPASIVAAPYELKLPESTSVLTNELNCGGSKISLDQALVTSCNTAFAGVGMALGAEKIAAQAALFGFGTRPLADLKGVASRFPEGIDQAQTALSAIGQYEVAATPLQMAMVAAGIANDGSLMEPYLVETVRSPELAVLSRHNPREQSQPMSPNNAQALQKMMIDVVQQGTGYAAQIDGVVVGGKTGTAQSDPKRPPYAWFVAFSRNPDVAIAVFVEDANVARNDIAGGRLAAPIARAVIEALR